MKPETRAQVDHAWRHGDAYTAIHLLKEASEINQKDPEILSEYLFALHFAPLSQAELSRQHSLFKERFEPRGLQVMHPHPRKQNGKIRIGYLSPDLYSQASHYIIYPILKSHDRDTFEIFIYSTHSAFDAQTQLIKDQATAWRNFFHTDYSGLQAQIQKDQIDILIDLAGHTGVNSMPLFARRAAPIQISWFGYMDTSGLSNMDFRLTDLWRNPPGSEQWYSEKLLYVPNSYTFESEKTPASTHKPPFFKNGYVTFGSLNSTYKINQTVIKTWAEILRANPRSKLLMLACPSQEYGRWIQGVFKTLGINPGRVEAHPRKPLTEFLETLNVVDIALDPFPYTGGVTTYHALSMGIPSITLEGETEYARNCAAILREASIPEYITSTRAEYIKKALEISHNPEKLLQTREQLLQNLINQKANITEHVERAFFEVLKRKGGI